MQKGTAKKWVAALDKAKCRFISSQFGYVITETNTICRDPFGVLFDAIGPDLWSIGWDGVSHLWQGEQFAVPQDFINRSKMKTTGEDLFTGTKSFHEAASIIKDVYREI